MDGDKIVNSEVREIRLRRRADLADVNKEFHESMDICHHNAKSSNFLKMYHTLASIWHGTRTC